MYPGRKSWAGNQGYDYNCNGIWGFGLNRKPLKEKYCKDSGQIGVAVIGDSAGAHFSIPEKYFNVSMIGNHTYKDLFERVSDELDLPHKSAYTGFAESTGEELVSSIYKNMVRRNRCNKNDYQNVAVNGGDSENTFGNMKALARNNQTDHPLLLFLEMIGSVFLLIERKRRLQPQKHRWLDQEGGV